MFLKELTELSGVSGNEFEVRNFIKKQLKEMNISFNIDKLGNVVAHNKGKQIGKKILLAAHMDEVGLITADIDAKGFIKFKTVGGLDNRVIVSKIVEIGDKKIPGIIGCKPIHLAEESERGKEPKTKDLYIDIGTTSKEETEKIVDIGDYITFKSNYLEFGNNKIKGKALDDRIGCSILLNILRKKIDIDFYVAFTVMEEVGLIGAQTVAYNIEPDLAIILEGTISADLPEVDDHSKVTIIGNGPALSIIDSTTIYKKEMIEFTKKIAKMNNIPLQIRKSSAGGNDAGPIHVNKAGAKVISLSVPCRYIHSPTCVASKDDYLNAEKLVNNLIKNIEVM